MKKIRYKKIRNTRKNVFEAFKKLGYKFINTHADSFYIFTPENKELKLIFRFNNKGLYDIEHKFPDFNGSIMFNCGGFDIKWLGDTTITIMAKNNTDVFINFHNFK